MAVFSPYHQLHVIETYRCLILRILKPIALINIFQLCLSLSSNLQHHAVYP
jgi:hypothetical protein